MRLDLTVNGTRRSIDVDPARTLLSVLRDDLELTGPKYGCGEGQCGACTVLLGGRAIRSCMTPVSRAVSAPITTIEGLERDGRLHPVQQAFIHENALQCGYCTPGMIMAGVGLLAGNASPDAGEIGRALEGNICRCGTHPRVIAAIQRAAGRRPAPAAGRPGEEVQP
jgi:aerobic-type carbon monoxide dehydrogenase small subunit (CoxS/CutS family)